MAAKPPHLGTRIYWWGILVLRLLFTHPLRWQGERNRWEPGFIPHAVGLAPLFTPTQTNKPPNFRWRACRSKEWDLLDLNQ